MAKAPADLRSLARAHTEMGIQTLAGIARNSTSDSARVQAVALLLDRGWGRPSQAHTGENGEGDIRVTIRHIVEGIEQQHTLQIDAVPVPVGTDDDTEGER